MECEKIKIKDLMLPLLHVVTESILCLLTVKNTFFFVCLLLLNQSNRRRFPLVDFFIYEFLNENQSRMFRCRLSICSYQKRKITKLDLVWAPFLTLSIFLRAGSQRRSGSLAFGAIPRHNLDFTLLKATFLQLLNLEHLPGASGGRAEVVEVSGWAQGRV